jgi:hypothetical protein
MAFNGNEGEMIDATIAQGWIDNYAKSVKPGETTAVFYGFRKLSELLGQGTAIGVRIYFAKKDDGSNTVVLVAVTPEEKNIAKIAGSKSAGLVLDMGSPCPQYCNNAD